MMKRQANERRNGLAAGIAARGFENAAERNLWISYFLVMAIATVSFYFYKPQSFTA